MSNLKFIQWLYTKFVGIFMLVAVMVINPVYAGPCDEVIPEDNPTAAISEANLIFDITDGGLSGEIILNSFSVDGVSFSELLGPDTVSYSFASPAYNSQYIKHGDNFEEDITDGPTIFDPALLNVMNSRDLNYYFACDPGSGGGVIENGDYVDFKYDTPITSAGNRHFILTERGGNNPLSVVALDEAGNPMGTTLSIAPGAGTAYVFTGVKVNKVPYGNDGQDLYAVIYPLTALVPRTTPIYGLRLIQNTINGDGGDSKIFIMVNPASLGCTITANDDNFTTTPIAAGGTTPSVFADNGNTEDDANGSNATNANIDDNINIQSDGGLTDVTINTNGTMVIPVATPGNYDVKYQICLDVNNTICDTATATVTVAQTPRISVEKTGTFMDENADGYANVGETISYEFNVTNIGNVTLYDVNITDDNSVITGGPITSIIPGESDTTTFTGVHTVTWQDIIDGVVINQAIVTAKDPQGNDINDTSDDPQNPVNEDPNGDGEPDDPTSTGLPIKPPASTNDTGAGATGQDVTIDIVNNDNGGTFALNATTVTLTPPIDATGIVTDIDGDTIGFVVSGEGTWSVDETTGEVTFSPEAGYIGDPTPIEYTIEDTQGNPTTSEISINYPPVANDDNVTVRLNEVVTLNVLTNDQNTTDPLDPTTVRFIDPSGNEVTTLTVLEEGRWTVDTATGEVTFDPDMDYTGDVTVPYVVRETNGELSNEAMISIVYVDDDMPLPVPLPIDAVDDTIIITHYGPTVINVLDNDNFGSNGPGTQEIIFTQPAHGTVSLDNGGTPNDPTDDVLIYEPDPDINNIKDSFTYTITDAVGNTATAIVTLNVNCGSSQTSDGGDALGMISMLMMMFFTAMSGLYFVRKEEERGEI